MARCTGMATGTPDPRAASTLRREMHASCVRPFSLGQSRTSVTKVAMAAMWACDSLGYSCLRAWPRRGGRHNCLVSESGTDVNDLGPRSGGPRTPYVGLGKPRSRRLLRDPRTSNGQSQRAHRQPLAVPSEHIRTTAHLSAAPCQAQIVRLAGPSPTVRKSCHALWPWLRKMTTAAAACEKHRSTYARNGDRKHASL